MLLDESHLELLEDILKEANFNKKDCFGLGLELRIYGDLEFISPRDILNLKECLRLWLSPDTTSYFLQSRPSTLYDLAAALYRIGYYEAGEYIIKTCKLIIMFNDQCY